MRKSNQFYISYSYSKADGSSGFGDAHYTQKALYPLTREVIGELLEDIKVTNNFETIVLISFGRFES